MSSSIDERVVEMRFDNKDFVSRISDTIKSLGNLKKSLDLNKSTKSLNALENSLNNVNFSKLSNGVQAIADRFTNMGIVATTVLQNITNAAFNTGTQLVKSLTLDSAMSGFREYETQMNSILTILNNTKSKGSTLDDVNAALNELNTYADQTIYNFTEMTENIGRFTAAGVDLQTSVDSIKGISNLAAFFGSSSMQASSAMYQLSQAIAAGKVQLMDWNSVVNAGMGGPEFQEALKRTATHFGTNVDGMIEKYGSFRESLTQGGWLTADVLTETLKQISGAYTEADLIAQGYTEDQARAITQMAADATDAATKVRTLTQLMSTIQEAMGSGWTNSWQIIEGDFEDATANWSGIYEKLAAVIQKSSDDRNALLQEWADLGGRTELWAGINSMLDTFLSYADAIKKGFQDVFPPATAQQLYDITKGFSDFWKNAAASTEQAEALRGIVSDLASVFKWVIDGISGATDGLGKFTSGIGAFNNGAFGFIKSITGFIKSLTEGIDLSGAFSFVLSGLGDTMSGVGRFLTFLGSGISFLSAAFSSSIGNLTGGLANLTGGIGTASQGITEIILSLIEALPKAIGVAISAIGKAVSQILDAVPIHEVNSAIQDTLFTVILGNITKFTKGLVEPSDAVSQTFGKIGDAIDKFAEVLDAAKGSIKSFATSIKANALIKIAVALGILALSIKTLASIPIMQVASSLGALAGGMVIMGAAGVSIIAILKKMAGGIKGAAEIASLATTLRKIAFSMLLFSAAIRIMASSLEAVSSLSWDEIGRGLAALAGLSGIAIAVAALMKKVKGIGRASASLIVFSGAITLLSMSLKSMGDLSWDEIIRGILGVAASAAILVGSSKILSKGAANYIRSSVILLIFSGAIRVMANALGAFSEVPVDSIMKSVGALGGIMAILKLFANGFKDIDVTDALGIVAVLLTYGEAIKAFAEAAMTFNDISIEAVAKTLVTIGVLMAELQIFTKKLAGDSSFLEVGGGLMAIAEAVQTFADSIQIFQSMSLGEIAKGTAAVGAGLLIMLTAMHHLPKDSLTEAVGFVAVAYSLKAFANAIKEFGTMDVESIGRAILVFASSMGVLAVSARLLKGTASGSGSFSLFAFGLSLLVGPIKMLGAMDLSSIAKAVLALSASLTVIGVASKILGSMSGSILKTAGSLIVMGAAITVFGIGLTAMMFPIKELANLDSTDLTQGVVSLTAVIGTMFALVKSMNALPDFSLKTIAKVAIMSAVIAGVGGVLGQLASIDSESAMQASVALSTTLMSASAALKVLDTINITGAAKGVATMAIIIGGIAAVVAAAGGIAQIPGAKWLIGEGASFISSLGQAIGGLIGGLIGGVAGGVISSVGSTLPEFGKNLSDFMTNAAPFFSGISSVNPESLSGISALATAMLALTGANILEAATSWLTGGNTMVNFGKQLAEFAPYFKQYADTISGIDAASVKASATAAKGLSEFATSLPAEGGLLQKIMGENDIAQFGKKLAEFGPSFKQYADSVAGLDPTSVINSANAAKALSEFAKNIPAEGGILQKITGDNDIVQFGNKLKEFGPALKAYADSVTGLDGSVVVNSANAAKALAEVATNLPAQGGALQWLMGEQNLETFGNNLEQFGVGMKKYGENVSGINPDSVSASAAAAKSLVEVASSLENSGSVFEFFTGKKDLAAFGDNLAVLGSGMNKYATSVAGIDATSISTSVSAAQGIAGVANSLQNSGGVTDFLIGNKDLGGFAGNLKALGAGIRDYSNSVSGVDFSNVPASTSALSSLSQIQNSLGESGGVVGWWSGDQDLGGFAGNLKNLGIGIRDYANSVAGVDLSNVSPSVSAVQQIGNLSSSLAGNDMTGITTFSETIKNVGDMGLNQFNESLAASATEASTNMSSLASAVSNGSSKIVTAFSSLKNNLSNQKGLFENSGKEVIQATIDGMASVFTNNSEKFSSWGSFVIDYVIKGMNRKRDAVSTALNSIVGSLKVEGAASKLVETGKDIIEGLISGMRKKESIAVAAAYNIGKNVANAANDGAGVHSPSRITTEGGKYVDEGFVVGMDKYLSKVVSASKNLGYTAAKTVNMAAAGFSPSFLNDVEYTPKIRPVFDGSNIDSLYGGISSSKMINLSGSVDIQAINASNNALAERIAQEQQATRASNQMVIDEISGLRSDLEKFIDADPQEIAFYVDSKKLASTLAKPMNRELQIQSKRGGLS